MDRPLSRWWCMAGWLASSVVFITFVQLLDGPSDGDATESAPSTWAIAHGQLVCAFPKKEVLAAPLYSYVSGGIAALTRIGHGVPFPSAAALGPNCSKAFNAVWLWGWQSNAISATLRIGYLGWIVLLAGVVALLRAAGRGRCGWEPATLFVLACLPPIWMSLENFFHPQDLLAMGLALGALACVLRDKWLAAGVLIALGLLTQQFTLLVAAPLLVVAPSTRRWTFVGAAAATTALALLLFFVSAGSGAVRTALIGTGNQSGVGGTWLAALHLSSGATGFISRVVPLELSLVLAWSVAKRLGRSVLEQVPLLSVVALSLSFRLVFEQNLLGYYFMALAVMLVLLDVLQRRIRAALVVWLAAVSLVFFVAPGTAFLAFPVYWTTQRQIAAPIFLAVILVALGLHVLRHGPRRTDLLWVALVGVALLAWPATHNPLSRHVAPGWWQVLFVSTGIALAATPLVGELRRHGSLTAHTAESTQPSIDAEPNRLAQ
ncbi:MAG TPA: hypothetical protein VIX84_22835 [Acidimicrobiales bacterium]